MPHVVGIGGQSLGVEHMLFLASPLFRTSLQFISRRQYIAHVSCAEE